MSAAWLYDGLRTPFGRHGGALAPVRPDELAAGLIRALLARVPLDPAAIEDVVLGCAGQAGEDGRNLGRNAALLAGLPVTVGGATVNRLCGSGLQAVIDAARAIRQSEGRLFLAGGVESMTRAPFVLSKAASPFGRDVALFDTTLGARFPHPALVAAHGNETMAETAELVAARLGIDRAACDRFALGSQRKAEAARAAGRLAEEIAPVTIPPARRGGAPVVVAEDEHPRPDTSLDSLARLRPLAEGGVVTAGNASGINDGAALLLLGDESFGAAHGLAPLARLEAAAIAGVEPRLMGLGPMPAIAKVLDRAGLLLADLDLIEINEAFAAQVLGCCHQLGLHPDDPRLNPNGGAIALGHPLGASGARLVLAAARELRRRGGGHALVTLCIGIGQGIALILASPDRSGFRR
jgi:acetyl-CoA C-acetyltransferase